MKRLVAILTVIAVLALSLAPVHAGGYGHSGVGNFGAAGGGYGTSFSQVTTTYSQQQVAPALAAPMGYGGGFGAAGGCAPAFAAPVGYGSSFGAAGGCSPAFGAPVGYGGGFRGVNNFGSVGVFGAGNGVTLGQVGGTGRGKFKQRSGIFGTRTVQKLR